MGFTVHRLSYNDPVTNRAQWAVVLDREHVMFVGDYQQCEEWLDYHELVETTFDSTSPKPPAEPDATVFRRIKRIVRYIAQWCRQHGINRAVGEAASFASTPMRGNVTERRRTAKTMIAFANDESGHVGAGESVAAAALVGLLWIGTTLITLLVPWTVAAHCSALLRGPAPTRTAVMRSAMSSSDPTDSLDIVCDLAANHD